MDTYEIRIVKPRSNKPLVVSTRMVGDFHAIRRAQAMAGEDDRVEVWRGMRCIFQSEPERQIAA